MNSMTPYELELAVLFAIEETEAAGNTATIGDIRRLIGNDNDAADLAQRLVGKGHLRRGKSLAGDYQLTLDGSAQAQTARERQNSRQWRRTTCRRRMLAWLDNQGPVDAPVDPSAFAAVLDGRAFDEDEVAEALEYLIEMDLAQSLGPKMANGRWHVVAITRQGSDCVDSNLELPAFLERQEPSRSNQTFNMSGTGNTFATATSDGATATANVSNTFNIEAGRLFAQAVRVAESDLGLSREARDALVVIETTEDPGVARRAADVLYQFILAAAAGTTGQILGVYGASLLGLQG